MQLFHASCWRGKRRTGDRESIFTVLLREGRFKGR
jgi:hypothetical protein